jgi:predicted RNase H-like HicB family nuclease
MMALQHTVKVVIRPGEQSRFVAECVELPIVTQGATVDEVAANLREAVALHLEGQDLGEMGLASSSTVIVTFELEACPASS